MTVTEPSEWQLFSGLSLFAGTVIAVLAATLGHDPLTGAIVLGGSTLVAWTVATRGERWVSRSG